MPASDSLRPGLWTSRLGRLTGHPAAFAVVFVYGALWFYFDRKGFDWHALATLIVWLMTLFIQRSDRRDTLAIHAKLDELLRSHSGARNELVQMDDKEPEEIEEHRKKQREAP